MKIHTKGSWIAYHSNTSDLPHRVIADCGAGNFVITQQSGNVALREHAEGNSQLIAAAPDMLAACEAALKVVSEISDIDGESRAGWTHRQLVDAIAKAEGRQP